MRTKVNAFLGKKEVSRAHGWVVGRILLPFRAKIISIVWRNATQVQKRSVVL